MNTCFLFILSFFLNLQFLTNSKQTRPLCFIYFPKQCCKWTTQHWKSIVNEENAILGKVSTGANLGIMMLPSLSLT